MDTKTGIINAFARGVLTNAAFSAGHIATLGFFARAVFAVLIGLALDTSTLVDLAFSGSTDLIGLTSYARARLDTVSIATEFTGSALFSAACIHFTFCLDTDLIYGATVGITVIFNTCTSAACLSGLAGRVTGITVAVSSATTCVGCCTSDVVTRIVNAISCGNITDTAFAALHRFTLVGDAGGVVADLTTRTCFACTFISFTSTFVTDLVLGTGDTSAGLDAFAKAAEFTTGACFSGTQVGLTDSGTTDLFGRATGGVAIVFDTAIPDTAFACGTGGLAR